MLLEFDQRIAKEPGSQGVAIEGGIVICAIGDCLIEG